MENTQVKNLLIENLQLDEAHVESEGTHYRIVAVGECFDGLSRVKQQQLVMKPLQAVIADGTIHAVTIKTFTPTQWKREKHFNLPA